MKKDPNFVGAHVTSLRLTLVSDTDKKNKNKNLNFVEFQLCLDQKDYPTKQLKKIRPTHN